MTIDVSHAPGRLRNLKPIAIIDIGSNSVRMVAYEGLTRSPTPIFNDKVMCGLGRGVATTGHLAQDGIQRALAALRRFRTLCDYMQITNIHVLATAAARDAVNGPDFLKAARAALGVKIELLSGQREAELSALGVISGFYNPDGVVGDLGGGSLELNDVKGAKLGKGSTLQLGGLALMDMSGKSPKKAIKIVRAALINAKPLAKLKGRTFYAVGGTWRALARLHMRQRNYPLNVMHHYEIAARDAADFTGLVERVNTKSLASIASVPAARRPLLAYGAVVLDEIIRTAKPKNIVVSALGVREGLLYERLSLSARQQDPLLAAARELNQLRSRAPQHGEDLCGWTDVLFKALKIEESHEERRLRHAACLLADIGWRAHPDYRGEQSLNIIANAAFVGVDHAGRAFLALVAAYRHMGLDDDVSPHIRVMISSSMLERARILGAALRFAYVLSAAMPNILPYMPFMSRKGRLVLTLPSRFKDLVNERVHGRLKQMTRVIGCECDIKIK